MLKASKDKQEKIEKQKKAKKDPTKITALLPDGTSHIVTLSEKTTAGDIQKAMEMCWRDPEAENPNFEAHMDLPEVGNVTFWLPSIDVDSSEISKALSIWYGVNLKDTKLIRHIV